MQLTVIVWRWDPYPLDKDHGSALVSELYDRNLLVIDMRRQNRPEART